ncbi:MAG TPA: hypothetical protein PKK37_03795 [Candidatus Pacearchaeota archaeon]|nr:hypothetical protein [Candidatus Pacearchaeota archaeon]
MDIASAGVFSVLFVLGAFASMGVASPRGVGWVVNSCGFFIAGVVCFNDKSFLVGNLGNAGNPPLVGGFLLALFQMSMNWDFG